MRTHRIPNMSLPWLLALGLLLALAVVATRAGLSSADQTALSLSRQRTLDYTVIEHPVSDTTVDVGAHGDSVGDLLPFANPIYNRANTVRVGSDEGSCERTRVGVAYYCDFVISLGKGPHRGRVVVAGSFFDDPKMTSTFVVTGGTGAFAHAAGPMRLTTRSDGSYNFRFHLTY